MEVDTPFGFRFMRPDFNEVGKFVLSYLCDGDPNITIGEKAARIVRVEAFLSQLLSKVKEVYRELLKRISALDAKTDKEIMDTPWDLRENYQL